MTDALNEMLIRYVYDLEVTAPDSTVTRLLEGGFTVYEGVTS